MKCTEREVKKLVEELDKEQTGTVNYNEFLKYSYLCQMYIYHYNLEFRINEIDTEKKGMVSVAQLDEILKTGKFNFPDNAIDTVLKEMLGCHDVDSIDRACFIQT